MLGIKYSRESEHLVNSIQEATIKNAITLGYDVVADNVHLNVPTYFKEYSCVHKYFDADLDTLIERDSKRQNPVGADVIKSFKTKFDAINNSGERS